MHIIALWTIGNENINKQKHIVMKLHANSQRVSDYPTFGRSSSSSFIKPYSSCPSSIMSSLAAVTCRTSCDMSFCWNLVRLPRIPTTTQNFLSIQWHMIRTMTTMTFIVRQPSRQHMLLPGRFSMTLQIGWLIVCEQLCRFNSVLCTICFNIFVLVYFALIVIMKLLHVFAMFQKRFMKPSLLFWHQMFIQTMTNLSSECPSQTI